MVDIIIVWASLSVPGVPPMYLYLASLGGVHFCPVVPPIPDDAHVLGVVHVTIE
jgi:hypothetical protein